MKILFVDSVSYRPYDCDVLRSEALGGTEATVLRVARGLAREGLDVSLFQLIDAGRKEKVIDGIRHVNAMAGGAYDVIVHLRTAKLVETFQQSFPTARHIVWLHDLCQAEPEMENEELVVVSDFHKANVEETLVAAGIKPKSVTRIYNAVEIDGHRLDPVEGRLGFFSSPHKGLEQVVQLFCDLDPKGSELVVGNPGYLTLGDSRAFTVPGVRYLGELSHSRVLEEMSKCQVLFQVQTKAPETFGLVLAEANAMGVPVLCHDFGAAAEVLCGQMGNEVIDCTKPENVAAALERIKQGRPKMGLDGRFSINAVIKQWKELLGC